MEVRRRADQARKMRVWKSAKVPKVSVWIRRLQQGSNKAHMTAAVSE